MIRIEADGDEIAMNDFVQRLIEDVIIGMVKNLKGSESAKEITVFIERD
jgi:hypothetical protein